MSSLSKNSIAETVQFIESILLALSFEFYKISTTIWIDDRRLHTAMYPEI